MGDDGQMTDFISREELKSKIRAAFPSLEDRCRINEIVNSIPAADVAPVVHAEWIENDNGTWSCSRCKSWLPNEQHYYARFCLHCGAKMDGGEKDAVD